LTKLLHRAIAVLGVVVALTALVGQPVTARAVPNTNIADSAAAEPIGWLQLGRSDRIDILGSDQPVDTDIPVLPGVTPDRLTGFIGSVVNVIDGRVDVLDERGITLASIPAPGVTGSAPFDVDISGALVTDGIAKLSFVVRSRNPRGDSCTRPPSLTLGQLASTYTGRTPYPSVVSDFMPAYLDQFLIRTGPTPSAEQQQAVLDLAAKLTRRYRPIPVRIDVDTSTGPTRPGPPTSRVIELRDGSPTGLAVNNPNTPEAALIVTGRGEELSRQIALFTDRRFELAQNRSASVDAATADIPRSTTIMTLGQLGVSGQTSVQGTATLYVGIDIGQFAVGSVQQATLRLIGHYTPVTGGEASVVVRSGGAVLAARRLDESGQLDITGTIPAESIQSNVGVAVDLRYLPSQPCAPLNDRIQFALDPASTVVVTSGTGNRGGFPALPMAFTPDFDVVVDRPDHLRFAVAAINLLALQTAATLHPRLADMATAARSGRGLLAVAPGPYLAQAGLRPTVLPGPGDSVDIGGALQTEVDLNGPAGVVQVFSQSGRKILALSGTGDWSLVDAGVEFIRALPSGWASLSGDVVATGSAGRTVSLTLREGGPLINEYPGDSWKRWMKLTAVMALAVLGFAGAVLFWRRWRRRGR
jgi:hypothetical protein